MSEGYLIGSNSSAPSTSATRYQFLSANGFSGGGVVTWDSTLGNRTNVLPMSGTIDFFRFRVATAPGSGKSWTLTLNINGSDTTVVATISNTATEATWSGTPVSFSAGDTITIKAVPSGTPTGSGNQWWNIGYTASVPGELMFLFGSDDTVSAGNTTYNGVQHDQVWSSTETGFAIMPTAGDIKKLYVKQQFATGAAKSCVYTLRKNLADGTNVVTIAGATDTKIQDTTHTDSFSAGDRISIKCVAAAAIGIGYVTGGVVWVPTTTGENIILHGGNATLNVSSVSYEMVVGTDNGNAISTTEGTRKIMVHAGTLKKYYGYTKNTVAAGSPGSGKSYTWKLRQTAFGGSPADSGLTFVIEDLTNSDNDTTHTATLADGDWLEQQFTPSGTPTARNISAGLVILVAPAFTTTPQTILGLARIAKAVLQTILGRARITAATARTVLGKAKIRATGSLLFGPEDFETGSTPWIFDSLGTNYNSATATLDTTSKVHLANSIKFESTGTDSGASAVKNLGMGYSDLYVQWQGKLPTGFTFGANGYIGVFAFRNAANDTDICFINYENFGSPQLVVNGPAIGYRPTAINISLNTVFTVEVRVKVSATVGRVQMWFNNNVQGSPDFDTGDISTGTNLFQTLVYGITYSPDAMSAYYGDMMVADEAFIGTRSSGTTTPQTITGLARILKTVTRTVQGLARIQKSVTQTVQGLARITKAVPQTITGLARITASTTRTVLGKAAILLTVSRTIQGLSRIQKSVTQTILGRARITALGIQTVLGRARITVTTSRTITGLADIYKTTSRTVTGLARIVNVMTRTIQGVSRITKTVTQTVLGRARIGNLISRTILGKADILKAATQNILGMAAMSGATTRTIQGLAKITATTTRTILGKGAVLKSATQTILGRARITLVTSRTILGLARVTATTTRTVLGRARVGVLVARTILGRSRIINVVTRTITGRSRITATTTQDILGRARIQSVAPVQTENPAFLLLFT